jgi:hypothetical protein
MAHKARRRPSWKKPNRWFKCEKYHIRYIHDGGIHIIGKQALKLLKTELFNDLSKEIQEEINKEILESIGA